MAASGSGAPGRVLMIPLFSPTRRVKAEGETALRTMFAGRPRTANAFVSPTAAAFRRCVRLLGIGTWARPVPTQTRGGGRQHDAPVVALDHPGPDSLGEHPCSANVHIEDRIQLADIETRRCGRGRPRGRTPRSRTRQAVARPRRWPRCW